MVVDDRSVRPLGLPLMTIFIRNLSSNEVNLIYLLERNYELHTTL